MDEAFFEKSYPKNVVSLKKLFNKWVKRFSIFLFAAALGLGIAGGGCFIAFECISNADCPEGEFCRVDGVCVFFNFCNVNADCIDGEFCGDGAFCQTANPPPVPKD